MNTQTEFPNFDYYTNNDGKSIAVSNIAPITVLTDGNISRVIWFGKNNTKSGKMREKVFSYNKSAMKFADKLAFEQLDKAALGDDPKAADNLLFQ